MSRALNQVLDHCYRLYAVHRFLHFRINILNTQANMIEAFVT